MDNNELSTKFLQGKKPDFIDKKLNKKINDYMLAGINDENTPLPEDTQKNRLMYSGINAAALGSALFLLKKMKLGGLNKLLKHQSYPSTIIPSAAAGYFTLPLMHKLKKDQDESGDNLMKKQSNYKELLKDFIIDERMEKNSSIGHFLKAIGKGAFKTTKTGLKEGLKGLKAPMPWKKGMSLGDRALSFGTKGLAGYGTYKGAKGLYKAHNPTPHDYHTHLRNNILAGNLQPEQIPQRNMRIVMERGLS